MLLAVTAAWADCAWSQTPAEEPSISVAPQVLDGAPPQIRVSGFSPKSVLQLHALRCFSKWQSTDGRWQQVPTVVHAWADFQTNEQGELQVDRAEPVAGVYAGADPLGLLRNGRLRGDSALSGVQDVELPFPDKPSSSVFLYAAVDGTVRARAEFELVSSLLKLDVETVAEGDLHGVFARPAESKQPPVVISLHGSEGGSVAKARSRAKMFAARGFACLAINYFAREFEGIDGLRTEHSKVPIETIRRAREWLRERKDVSADRIALHGTSKGAEFALLAASQYGWIRSVVAVVPSDAVWEGYRDGGGKGARSSSWSIAGEPVPYIPLFDFDPAQQGLYRTNTERYSRSRAFYAEEAKRARIPIEKATAKILLIASDRDEVWASGEMSRNLAERLVDAGKPGLARVIIFPRAGHQISGTGTFPVFLYGTQSDDPADKDLVAEGQAAARAWSTTIEFLRETLDAE